MPVGEDRINELERSAQHVSLGLKYTVVVRVSIVRPEVGDAETRQFLFQPGFRGKGRNNIAIEQNHELGVRGKRGNSRGERGELSEALMRELDECMGATQSKSSE